MLLTLLSCAWLTPADLADRLGGDTASPPHDDTGTPDTDCAASTWYADADGDDFGDDDVSVEACDQPDGYLGVGGDCDDGDVAVHPEQIETCGNGTDEDCDGVDAACFDGVVEIASVGALSSGAALGDEAGYWVKTGDYDADGSDDWVVSAPFQDGGGADAGAIYVMDGQGAFGTPLEGTAMAAFVGGAAGDFLGVDFTFAGNMAGDGACNNLVVGGPGFDGPGLDGGFVGLLRCGLVDNYDLALHDVIALGIEGPSAGIGLGAALAGGLGFSSNVVGPLDDLAIAGPGWSGGRGAVWVVFGELVDVDNFYSINTGIAMLYEGEHAGDNAGYSVGHLGDHTGDGFDDLGVGAPGVADTAEGKVHVVGGGEDSVGTISLGSSALTLFGESDGDKLGHAVVDLGDVDGDGLHDFAVSSKDRSNGRGAVYIVLGENRGRDNGAYAGVAEYASTRVLGGDSTGTFGTWVEAIDLDEDGVAELVVSATQELAHSNGGGAVYAFHDLHDGNYTSDDASAVVYRDEPDGAFGTSFAELQADGHSTLLIGNTQEDGETAESGGVWALPIY